MKSVKSIWTNFLAKLNRRSYITNNLCSDKKIAKIVSKSSKAKGLILEHHNSMENDHIFELLFLEFDSLASFSGGIKYYTKILS